MGLVEEDAQMNVVEELQTTRANHARGHPVCHPHPPRSHTNHSTRFHASYGRSHTLLKWFIIAHNMNTTAAQIHKTHEAWPSERDTDTHVAHSPLRRRMHLRSQ
jgi:hypothetical protein